MHTHVIKCGANAEPLAVRAGIERQALSQPLDARSDGDQWVGRNPELRATRR